MTKLIHIQCPEYKFESDLDLTAVSRIIDKSIVNSFMNKKIVLRGIQSEKHSLTRDDLVATIIKTGTDKYAGHSANQRSVNDTPIDLFGYNCVVKDTISLSVLEGFHRWKPMSLERPQKKVDIWLIYDAGQLDDVEYHHNYYDVKAKDGYLFKDPENKVGALIGLVVID